MHEDDCRIQDEMADHIDFLSKADDDTMYFHQVMKAPDRDEFTKATINEMNDHTVTRQWELFPRYDIPKGEKVMDSVWAMYCKIDMNTQKALTYKARLNVHGRQHDYNVNYFETYYPVVTWASVCLLTTLVWLMNLHAIKCDFVLAYPHTI
jgi:hypothetical protein